MNIRLEFERLQKKAEAQAYLADIFEFPEYYGKNLDALSDSLSERIAAEPYEIIIEGAGMEEIDQWGYARGIIKVLKDLERRFPGQIQVFVTAQENEEEAG